MDEYRKQDLWMMFKESKEVTVTYVYEYYDWNTDKTEQKVDDVTYTIFDEAVADIRVRGQVEQVYF